MEKFELVVAEDYKFGNWAILKKSSTSWKFRTVKTRMQKTQIYISPIENFSTTGEFSMPTLIEEIKPVVLEIMSLNIEINWN